MAERQQVERIELLVEPVSDVPGPVDHLRTARRWWTASQRTAQVAADARAMGAASSTSNAIVTTFTGSTTFRRLVNVPGNRLETVLQAWWSRSSHDDGHLRLDRFIPDHDLFELHGSLRARAHSRRIPVEVRLSPYPGSWSLLELTPQRATHPSRVYFRIGHDSLDRFVAALRALV